MEIQGNDYLLTSDIRAGLGLSHKIHTLGILHCLN
jgi:hypothetical protein